MCRSVCVFLGALIFLLSWPKGRDFLCSDTRILYVCCVSVLENHALLAQASEISIAPNVRAPVANQMDKLNQTRDKYAITSRNQQAISQQARPTNLLWEETLYRVFLLHCFSQAANCIANALQVAKTSKSILYGHPIANQTKSRGHI